MALAAAPAALSVCHVKVESRCKNAVQKPSSRTAAPFMFSATNTRRRVSTELKGAGELLRQRQRQQGMYLRKESEGVRGVSAGATEASQDAATAGVKEEKFVKLKEFLEDARKVGRVRIIVNTGMGVLESVTTLDGVFFQEFGGKGEYANLMKSEENVDFHLLLNKVALVRLATAKSMRGNFTTYTMRFVDDKSDVGASIFVMWKPGTNGDYDEGQVEAFESLLEKYGEEVTFA